MKLNKIHDVAVICSDYEQSKYFNTEVLDRQAVCVLQRPRRTADRTVRKVKNITYRYCPTHNKIVSLHRN